MMAQQNRHLVALVLIAASALSAGCSTAPVVEGEEAKPTVFSADRVLQPGVTYSADIYDPWQGFNRRVYYFNAVVDKHFLLPASNAYKTVTPAPVRRSITNFFDNFLNLNTLLNSVLQLSPKKTAATTGRLVVNSTLGVLGLFDPATRMGIPQEQEDFGQTLGRWGVGPGPYLVLPLLGPSSLRDGLGAGVDWYVNNELRSRIFALEPWQEWTWTGIYVLNLRANLGFRYYETGTPFEYRMVRMLYTTKRRLDIER
jgi:phospholipid-binding lipoprotein MlaA